MYIASNSMWDSQTGNIVGQIISIPLQSVISVQFSVRALIPLL